MNHHQSIRSNISRAKNLGSSGHGSNHWLMQRMSALLMIPLFLWFVYFMISTARLSQDEILPLLQIPYNALPMLLLMISGLYHSMLGMQVVVEDYISCLYVRNSLIILLQLFTALTIFVLAFAVLYFVSNHG